MDSIQYMLRMSFVWLCISHRGVEDVCLSVLFLCYGFVEQMNFKTLLWTLFKPA